ncbi:MAG TPA: glycerol-3-phosphate 1-O-acyltransferase PlsY [Desulfobacterales bacterium]
MISTMPLEQLQIVLAWMLPPLAYLLGSIPFGVIIARRFAAVDIRSSGSGNIGATNVMRLAGVIPGLLTLAADILKGTVPVLLARILLPAAGELYLSVTVLAAVCGHMFSICHRFRGGKGGATTAGAFLAVAPTAVLIAAAGFVLAAGLSRRVSPGSLLAAVLLVPATGWVTHSTAYTLCAVAAAVLIALRHRSNIDRLIRGCEPPFRAGKQKR